MRRPPEHPRAFTLVELIATMAIVGVLGSVVSTMIGASVSGYTRAATTAQLASEISIALDRIDQVLRFIPLNSSGEPDITSVTATSITWDTNWTLSLSGTQLTLSEAGGTASVLLQDVSNLTITTYNESNAALASSLSGSACAPIQRIRVSITQTRGGVSETLRSRIFIRALMAAVDG